ncbi:MAG: site-specific DNA-methyltransferase, partial [Chloroflexi bacterium]|nr:site-specific DNA-methyltransferase [Chloroflexota bacterium]
MPHRKSSSKRQITQYDHGDKKRLNNPPVGMVTTATDRIAEGKQARKTYRYDPHIDPALQFDVGGAEIENIIDAGLGAESLEEAKQALEELKKQREPYLNWAGKAERTSFEVPTVSLHVHERIDTRTIIEAVRKRNGDMSSPGDQLSLFEQPQENPPLREAVEFYK